MGDRMTPETRFERIETALQLTAETLQTLAQSHVATQTTLKGMMEVQAINQGTLQTLNQSITVLNQSITVLNESVTRYVDAADARMRRLEENLDGLIRAITAEHSNGKSKNQ